MCQRYTNVTIDDTVPSMSSQDQVTYSGNWSSLNRTACAQCFDKTLHFSSYVDQTGNTPSFTVLFDGMLVTTFCFQ